MIGRKVHPWLVFIQKRDILFYFELRRACEYNHRHIFNIPWIKLNTATKIQEIRAVSGWALVIN